MIETGHLAAFLAFGLSLAQGVIGLRGDRHLAGRLAVIAFLLMGVAFATLLIAFARSDFSLALAVRHSHTLKPFVYKLAGVWGNHEGSMALWCLVTLGFGAAAARLMRTGRAVFEARALGVQGLLAAGALAYLLFASSPFTRQIPAPLQGAGLNPLLQDPGLALHPPMLYLGYVGYSFVFALAAAGLIEGRIDSDWAKEARRWSLAAFVPLTLGIALGSYWAYYELGWGGWWFWDPVENASLMPWLIGAALLHSVRVTALRGSFASWTALLAVLAFLFSILGAFLVRSGILTSVHAFAIDPERGMILLGGLIVYGSAALGLYAIRAPKLSGGAPWALISREGALAVNNIALVVAALTVLLGTLFPLMAEAAGRTVSVGEPYFRATFAPILGLALLSLPVVQAWHWGRADNRKLGLGLALAMALACAGLVAALGLMNMPLGASLGVALALWLILGAGVELRRRAVTLRRLFTLTKPVWGMTLAHAGIGVFILGAVIESSGRHEATLALPVGGSGEAAGWTLRLDAIEGLEGPNWYADAATLTATRGAAEVLLQPMKRFYPAAQMPTTETAIHKTGTGDLYAALGERRMIDGEARYVFRVYFNPLIDWVYAGAVMIALGAGLCLWPRRRTAP